MVLAGGIRVTPGTCSGYPKILLKWIFCRVIRLNDPDGMANSVDPDQTAPRSSLVWVNTVCLDLSVKNFGTLL